MAINEQWKSSPHEASPVDYDRYGTVYFPKDALPASSIVHAERTTEEAYPFQGHIGDENHPIEAGRYHLYVSWACPYAQRSAIVRELLGLRNAVSLSVVDPLRDGRGWAFRSAEGSTLDTGGHGYAFLREAYDDSVAGTYTHRVSVPVLWDKKTGTIVSNYFPTIHRELYRLGEYGSHSELDLYPEPLRDSIDETEQWVYRDINSGPYAAGFAQSQEQYEDAEQHFFTALERVDGILANHEFLVGDTLTEADVNLWTSLLRFWLVYQTHFKLNRHGLPYYKNAARFVKELYSKDAFKVTTNPSHIKRHYFNTQRPINPAGIVPAGPDLSWLTED
jgi:putative glutathione S-transferase